MQKQAFTAVIFAAIIYGTSGVFIKYLSIPATSIAWIRTAIPCIVMATWMYFGGVQFFRGKYKKMLLASSLNALRMYFFFTAYIFTSIGNAVIMYYTWPIFATILGVFVLKEKIIKEQLFLLILAFTGIIMAYSNQEFSFENKDIIGMSASVVSALLYSFSIIIFKSESLEYSSKEMVFYQNFVGMILYLPFIIFNSPLPNELDIELGIIYALLIGLIAYYLFFYGLKYLKASTATMLTYLEVVSALILSYLFFQELLNLNMIMGGSAIIISTAFLRRIERKD